MPVILARRADAGTRDGAVHAYQLPDRSPRPAVWKAVCGAELADAEAERVTQFTGAPCPVCLMTAFGQEPEVLPRGDELAPGLGTYPAYAPISPTGHYAVALWGERSLHFVADQAVRGQLDGRDVVQAICGHLGWGPLEASSTPRGWPVCSECLSTESPRRIDQ